MAHKILEQMLQVGLAHEAVMLEDAQKELGLARQVERRHHERWNKMEAKQEDPDGVQIGDNIHIHNPAKAAAGKLPGWLGPALMVGAGLLGGAGAAGLIGLLTGGKAPPAFELRPKEFDIHWEFKDGKFNIPKVEAVK